MKYLGSWFAATASNPSKGRFDIITLSASAYHGWIGREEFESSRVVGVLTSWECDALAMAIVVRSVPCMCGIKWNILQDQLEEATDHVGNIWI